MKTPLRDVIFLTGTDIDEILCTIGKRIFFGCVWSIR